MKRRGVHTTLKAHNILSYFTILFTRTLFMVIVTFQDTSLSFMMALRELFGTIMLYYFQGKPISATVKISVRALRFVTVPIFLKNNM